MRVAELTGLRFEHDVDLEKKVIHINHNLLYYSHKDEGGCRFLVGKPKTKSSKRTIVITEDVKKAFLMQKEYLEKSGIKCTAIVEGTPDVAEEFYTDFIFLNRDGKPYNNATLNKCIRRIVRDCNVDAMKRKDENIVEVPEFSNHCMRSSYITRCAENKVDLNVVMAQVGHSSSRVTREIYLTVNPDWMQRELAVMENMLK